MSASSGRDLALEGDSPSPSPPGRRTALLTRKEGDFLVIEGRPVGFVRAARTHGMLGLSKNACLLLFLLAFLLGAHAERGEGWGSGKEIVLGVLLVLVALACVSIVARALSIGRRSSRLSVGRGRLEFESIAGRGKRTAEWLYDDIDLIRVGRRRWGVDTLESTYLEIIAQGQALRAFEQYEPADLRRVEELLGRMLGLQTGSAWRPGSSERRPIPRPAHGAISLQTDTPSLVELRVPVSGLAYGTVKGLSILLLLAGLLGLLAAALGLDLPGEVGSFGSSQQGVLFAALALAGFGMGHFVAPLCASTLVLRAGDGVLSVDAPLRRRRTWGRAEIDRLGVDYVDFQDATELDTALVLWRSDGKQRTLLRNQQIVGRRAGHELYWAADQLQRRL